MRSGYLFFPLVFSLSLGFQASAQNRNDAPTFEAISDYTGNPYLVMNLLLSIDAEASDIIISNSIDGNNWEDLTAIPIREMHGNSYENTPLSISIHRLENLIAKTKHKILFNASYTLQGKRYTILKNIELTKDDLVLLKKKHVMR